MAILVRYVPVWLLIGTVTWLIARGLGQDVSWLDVAPATVLSWIVGFVLVPVPGGVGVREAAFVAAAPELDAGVGAAIALVARMLFVLVDAGGFGLATLWLARHRTGPATPAEAESAAGTGADPGSLATPSPTP